jgi:hypothetical protein
MHVKESCRVLWVFSCNKKPLLPEQLYFMDLEIISLLDEDSFEYQEVKIIK